MLLRVAVHVVAQHADEVAIVHGVLKVSNKCVADAMVHMVCGVNTLCLSTLLHHKWVST
jgi:hypothetical protein